MKNFPVKISYLLLLIVGLKVHLDAQTVPFTLAGTSPVALQMDSYGNLSSIGTFGTGTFTITAASTQMFWYPGKAAFRAGSQQAYFGSIIYPGWNDANIGHYSTAFGYNTLASGDYSMSVGYNTHATGLYSVAIGGTSLASGASSVALGGGTASGANSTATGGGYAVGSGSVALGGGNSTGVSSTAIGPNSYAMGNYSMALGYWTYAYSYGAVAIGQANTRAQIFEDARAADGKVYDPSGVQIKPGEPWQTGHTPGNKFSDGQMKAYSQDMDSETWKAYQRDPGIYRPEIRRTNSGHQYEYDW